MEEQLQSFIFLIKSNIYLVSAYGFAGICLFVIVTNSISRMTRYKLKVNPKIETVKFHYP